MPMRRQSSRLSPEDVAEKYEQAWSGLKILGYPRVEAVTSLLASFELLIEVAEESPNILDVPKFVFGLKGLNMLVPHVCTHCPDQIIYRDELRETGSRTVGPLSGCDAAAMDALEFATMYGFFQDFAKSEHVSWRIRDEYSAEISVTDDHLFKQETLAALLWEEIDVTLPLRILEALVSSAPEHAMLAADEILNWQTGSFPLPDRLKVGNYTAGEWKHVLRDLIARALLAKMQAPEIQLPLIAGDIQKLTIKIAQEIQLPRQRVRDILHDLSFDPREEKANLARTPFVVVGDFLVGSPSLLLSRRADCQLLKQWSQRYRTTFNRSHRLIANRIHKELAEAFRVRGCDTWSDVRYTSGVDSKRRDIDVLARDSDENWLVIQVKAFLPPSPAFDSIADRRRECRYGLKQIADARDTIVKAPERVLERRVKRTNGKYLVKSCNGLLVSTHTYGVPPEAEYPSVEYVVLKRFIGELSSTISIPEIVTRVARAHRPVQDAPISWQVLSNSGFVLRFPYVALVPPGTTWIDRALSGPLFRTFRISNIIRRRFAEA